MKLREHFGELFAAQEAKKTGVSRKNAEIATANNETHPLPQRADTVQGLLRDSSVAEQRTHNPKVVGSNPSPATKSKFSNVKTNGYGSKKEAKRAADLAHMQSAGLIRHLREQVEYILLPKQEGERRLSYVADFVYEEGPTWATIVEDTKGFRTRDYIIKRKLMLIIYGIRLRET